MLNGKKLGLIALSVLIQSCTVMKPNIIAIDNIPSQSARDAVLRSVKVVWADEALLFKDVTQVSPIQIVVPKYNVSSFTQLFARATYRVRLFSGSRSNLLSVISVVNGSKDFCKNPFIVDDLNDYEKIYPVKCGDTVFARLGAKVTPIKISGIIEETPRNSGEIIKILIEYKQEVELGI